MHWFSPFSRRTYLCFLGLRLLSWNVGRPERPSGWNEFGPTKNPETKRRCQWKRSILLKGDTSEKMACFSIVMLVLGSVFWENYHDLMTCLMWWNPQICSPYSFNVVTTVTGRDDDAAGIVFPDRFSQRVAPTFRRPLFGITWLGFLVTFRIFKDGWYE